MPWGKAREHTILDLALLARERHAGHQAPPGDQQAPEQRTAQEDTTSLPEPDPEAYLTPREIMKYCPPSLSYEACRKRLERFRRDRHDGWHPVQNPRPREAHFVPRAGSVLHLLRQ